MQALNTFYRSGDKEKILNHLKIFVKFFIIIVIGKLPTLGI